MTVRVIHADCRLAIPELVAEGLKVDAIITDPPYGLEFMGKTWDRLWNKGSDAFSDEKRWKSRPAGNAPRYVVNRKCLNCGRWARDKTPCQCGKPDWQDPETPKGSAHYSWQMQAWHEAWAREAFAILKPGGFFLAFGGTRTEHRLACAIEDAGFVIEDKFLWVHGQGFPKNKNLLKPACEVITIAYRPGDTRQRQIDECRIPTDDELCGGAGGLLSHIRDGKPYPNGRDGEASAEARYTEQGSTNFAAKPGMRRGANTTKAWRGAGNRSREQYRMGTTGATIPTDIGRWPTNFAHDDSDEVLTGFPDSAGQQGDVNGTESSTTGESGIYGHFGRVPFKRRAASTTGLRTAQSRAAIVEATEWGTGNHESREYPGDSGSAARFFYAAKAGVEDRWGSRHPTVKPVELIKHLVALHCPPGGLFLDCFAGSGTAGVAALATGRNAILIEEDATHIADIRERMAFYEGTGRHSLVSKNRNRREATGTLL